MLIFDIETDGLLYNVTTIHCLVIHDTETGETTAYNDQGDAEPIVRGITYLEDCACAIGHNILSYDLPVINKLYPFFSYPPCVIDTLLLSRLYHANLMDLDKKHNWKTMPLKLYGRHSLEAYGHRLGTFKGDFGKTTDWADWSEDMEEYCRNDVKVTIKLWEHFQKKLAQHAG